MVLDETTASNSPSDFSGFSSDFPSDPLPPGSGLDSLEYSFSLDLTTLPRANALVAPFGRGEAGLRRSIAENVSNASKVLNRMPTQEEFNAMAYHTAKGQAIICWGLPTGIGTAAYMSWRTRKTYKFPFVKPSEAFNGNEVAFWGRQWLKGPQANIFWHSLRFSAYGIVGGWVAGMFVAGYAASIVAVGELTDPRLKELQDAIRKVAKVQLEKREGGGNWRNSETGKEASGEAATAMKRAMTGGGTMDSINASAGEDVDFAASQDREARLYGNGYTETNGGKPTDSIPTQSSPRSQRSPAWSTAAGTKSKAEPESSGGFYDTYDDASPTAPIHAPPRTDNRASIAGSAWERLRRQASASEASESTTTSTRPRRQIPASQSPKNEDGDSFSYSSSEEEKQLARDEAQRDFDAQVERERQGENFGDGGRRRW